VLIYRPTTTRSTRSRPLKVRSANVHFASWNNPATPIDETLPTFFTIAYRFLAADPDGTHYRVATKRLMFFLQHWNPDWEQRFSPHVNSAEAETFRASLMVAAVSYGTGKDLRPEFRALGFPVDTAVCDELTAAVGLYANSASGPK